MLPKINSVLGSSIRRAVWATSAGIQGWLSYKTFSKFMTNSEEFWENISPVFSSFSIEICRIWLQLATPAMEVCKSLHTLPLPVCKRLRFQLAPVTECSGVHGRKRGNAGKWTNGCSKAHIVKNRRVGLRLKSLRAVGSMKKTWVRADVAGSCKAARDS